MGREGEEDEGTLTDQKNLQLRIKEERERDVNDSLFMILGNSLI